MKSLKTTIIFFILVALFLKFNLAHAQTTLHLTHTRLYIPTSSYTTILKDNDNYYLLAKDYLSSTKAIINSQGQVSQTDSYYPYGSQTNQQTNPPTNQLTDKLFTGHRQLDNLDIYHFGARFYSPITGLFIQPDTVEGPERYVYANNSPIQFIDTNGTCSDDINANKRCTNLKIPEPIKNDLAPEYWERLRKATVITYILARFGNTGTDADYVPFSRGSGVSVSPGRILTNAHEANLNIELVGHPEAQFGTNKVPYLRTKANWISSRYDIAELKYDEESYGGGPEIIPIAKQPPKEGDSIFGLNYSA